MKRADIGNAPATAKMLRPRLAVLSAGLAAGLISSLAISALMLLAEKTADLPVGTFYLVLMSAISQTQDYSVSVLALGFLLHLAAGTVLGLVISTPFGAFRRSMIAMNKYAPVYGLAAGFALWSALFLPLSFAIMIPLLNSLDSQAAIRQQVPTGDVSSIATGELLAIMDRIVIGSLAFNVFYGFLAVILIKSFSEVFMRRGKPVVL